MNISEDQKRWLVIGIAFNKLVPQIRPFVEQSLTAEYQRLRSSHNIHIQTPPGPILKKHPKHLKYENINSNINRKLPSGKFDFSNFDYKVSSHVDFAKLYVQPFMAKFSAFDGKCDGSAVLLLLGEVPVFSSAIQSSAKVVKEHVRNEWAHCNFTDWDAVKFQSCFQEMQQLVQSIGLPTADETKLLAELNDWETKGLHFVLKYNRNVNGFISCEQSPFLPLHPGVHWAKRRVCLQGKVCTGSHVQSLFTLVSIASNN